MTGKLDYALNIVLSATDALKLDKFKFNGDERMGPRKHPKCKGSYDAYSGDFDCGYHTTIDCEQCKYCHLGGRKDPAAKCNQL